MKSPEKRVPKWFLILFAARTQTSTAGTMDHAKSSMLSLKTLDEKYDVLYVNTPWSAMPIERMEKLPLKEISSDNAALFVWTDSYSVTSASTLLDKWGFKFHSVFQVMDIAQYPWMKKAEVAAKSPKTGPETSETSETPEKPEVKKTFKKSRAPPVTPPCWWNAAPDMSLPSRPTTEQLWLAVKGDPSTIFGNTTTAYNVVNIPTVGKKSRSKKSSQCGEWELDRPRCFLDTVIQHVNPGVKILDLFSTCLHDKVDSWGPGLPGGYLKGFTKTTGIVAEINRVMRTMKKSQLQCLSQKIPKMLSAESEQDKKKFLSEMEESFVPISTALNNMKSDVPYNWKKDDGGVTEWTYNLVQLLAQRNVADFSSIRKKRKKRQPMKKTGNRPRHGIASPSKVSPGMAEFLKLGPDEKIARVTVVKILNDYINEHSLKNPKNQVEILLDEPLKKLLNPPANFGPVTFFNLCKLVGVHFPKKTEEEKKADKRAREEEKQKSANESQKKAKV